MSHIFNNNQNLSIFTLPACYKLFHADNSTNSYTKTTYPLIFYFEREKQAKYCLSIVDSLSQNL